MHLDAQNIKQFWYLASVLEFLLIALAHLTIHGHTNHFTHIWYPEPCCSSSCSPLKPGIHWSVIPSRGVLSQLGSAWLGSLMQKQCSEPECESCVAGYTLFTNHYETYTKRKFHRKNFKFANHSENYVTHYSSIIQSFPLESATKTERTRLFS